MRVLTLSLNKLELAHIQMRKPLIVIGRSPTCDVVLRAPGVKPIHFIVEWIGGGKFDPSTGAWTIVDVSQDAEAGEGLVLGTESIKVGDYSFAYIESNLESSDVIGGKILDNLASTGAHGAEVLEFVQVRIDSGAVEEVRHLPIPKKVKAESISHEFKSFKVEKNNLSTDAIMNVLLDELPGAVLYLSGKKLNSSNRVPLAANDFLQVKWNGRDFFLRFVDEVASPPIPQDFWGDPLLKKMTVGVGIFLALFLLLRPHEEPKPDETPPPRVARIEMPKPVVQKEAPPPEVVPKDEAPVKDLTTAKQKAPDEKSAAGASKVTAKPQAKPKEGLNTKAAPADVNKIGILGALNKNMSKGAGVRADQIINNGIIRESVSAKDDAKIVISNPPSGVIGSGSGGDPHGRGSNNLGAASTTLAGVKASNTDSRSLIAKSGGTGNASLGSSNSSEGQLGDNAGDFSVAGGGLDRDTVRKIIQSYRAQVRACYDRSLVSSPNLQGRIVYNWKILSDGSVVEAKIKTSSVESPNLRACVLEVINRMQFPKSARGLSTTVIYPFVFQGLK